MNEPDPATLELQDWAPAMQQRLQQRLQTTQVEVLDESQQHAGHAGANGRGYGTHFRVKIASPLFTDMPRVARHRLVYDALQDFLDQGAHALAIELIQA
jgi:BolA protein